MTEESYNNVINQIKEMTDEEYFDLMIVGQVMEEDRRRQSSEDIYYHPTHDKKFMNSLYKKYGKKKVDNALKKY